MLNFSYLIKLALSRISKVLTKQIKLAQGMSLPVLIILMVFAGVMGGSLNYLLPANRTEFGIVNKWWQCVVLGFGATLLVPLFLELAQSKLLDEMTMVYPKIKILEDKKDPHKVLYAGSRIFGDVVIRMTSRPTKDSPATKSDIGIALGAGF